MTVLSIDNLSGGYGEADIIHGISLEINAGEIVVVIGPNGAGKSTAMKAVFGLLRLSGGSVHLAGEVGRHLRERHKPVNQEQQR